RLRLPMTPNALQSPLHAASADGAGLRTKSGRVTSERLRSVRIDTLSISDFAHIKQVNIEFGDLTVLVGPQGSGKSLVLQILKLVIDGRVTAETMYRYGLLYTGAENFMARYLGQGMEYSWRGKTEIIWNDAAVHLEAIS